MSLHVPFDNSYARLPEALYTRQGPSPVARPGLVALNEELARLLRLDPDALRTPDGIAMLAGNAVPEGAAPLAQAYAGHQFGAWNPGLGDGRALLLGEVVGTDGVRRDIQLKGSGRTPYSRMGDGRAWLGPVLREYIVSEAMAALGVPTTRALAAVTTGETVVREAPLPGAILTRVARSHIRVGTFQLVSARGDADALAALAEHARARHYPEAEGVQGLLDAVIAAQADLIARWMGLGFIHGVMNTDNMSVAGETIDYGPCAFMDVYHPATVFSSIDHGGRYAYQNQPQIALWNLAQLASSLVPLMPDREAAVESFTASLDRFADLYQAAWIQVFGRKLGLERPGPDDQPLIEELLTLMARDGADFTNAFAALGTDAARDQFADRDAFAAWQERWRARGPDPARLAAANPRVIPRTHLIEAAIQAGTGGDFAPFHALLAAVTASFKDPGTPYTVPPTDEQRVSRTFCGT